MNKSEQINELAEALVKAQGEFPAVPKTGENPYFKSRYVTLDSIISAIKGPLSKNGIAYTQLISSAENGHILTTMLVHTSGQWISSTALIGTGHGAKNEMQALGSRLTYMKRYALSAMLGIAGGEDDDGNGSAGVQGKSHREQPEKKKPEQPQKKPATMKELWARWKELWNEAKALDLKVESLPTSAKRDVLIEHGKALAAAIETAKAESQESISWPAQTVAAVIAARLSENSHSVLGALKYSTLRPEDDADTVVNWFQQYRAARDADDTPILEAATMANAWLAGEVDDLDGPTSQTEDSRDSAL